jgi:hypothetical protein
MKCILAAVVAVGVMGCGQGATGDKGAPGESIVGPQGPAGTNGADGESITVVKLCPGETTYPSKFVEIAFCVQGKLYGTYSANGGFSTELPPGTYGSNGINASCNFAVLTNCGIQN